MLRRSTENGRLFDLNVFFFRLPLLRKVQTKCDDREEKPGILAFGAQVRHYSGHHFIYPGEVRLKCQLLNGPGGNTLLSARWGLASTMWHIDAVHPPRMQSWIVTTRGCKASCGSYFGQTTKMILHSDRPLCH